MVLEETGKKMAKSKAKAKTGARMQRLLERIADAAESHNAIETSQVTRQYSIPECIQILKSLKDEGVLNGDKTSNKST